MGVTYDVLASASGADLVELTSGIAELTYSPDPWDYGYAYQWRIDSTNEFGTTTGDVWTFSALDFDPPMPTVHIIDGGDPPDFSFGDGVNHTPASDPPGTGGVEGTDWEFIGTNGAFARKMVILAANNKVWIEDI